METLTLKDLHFRGKHGYYEEERHKGNDFEVDLIFHANLRQAGDSDKLDDTIDYQRAEKIVRSVMEGPSVRLIETLAKRIGDNLVGSFPEIQNLEVIVRKLNPPLHTKTTYSEIRISWPQ
ncbi:MAG: dihydroneopterin aldolase [Balneolaceae bacterium]|jgi:dihydroneopterin aldolase